MNICETPWGKLYFSWSEYVSIYEMKVAKEVKCPKSGTAIDLGAHQGYYTTKLAKEAGEKGVVYAFEPEPFNFKTLCENIELNDLKNVVPIQKAVSNYIGKGSLFTYDHRKNWDSGKHFLRGSTIMEAYGDNLDKAIPTPFHETRVDVTTLNAFKEEYDLKCTDLIKIDVEGAELKVIYGAYNLLNQFNPIIVIEIHYQHNLEKLMHQHGYYRTKHFENVRVTSNPISVYEKV